MKVRSGLFAAALMLMIGKAISAPINVEMTGAYYGMTNDPNFRLLATFEYDKQVPIVNGIGQYKLNSLSISFFPPFDGAYALQRYRDAFSLTADATQSSASFYPTSSPDNLAYLQFSGSFATGLNYFPNGIQGTTYFIGIEFAQVNVDNLTSQPLVVQIASYREGGGASLYIANQIGAYSTNVTNPVLQISSVPEPESYALMLAGMGLIGIAVRRSKAA